MAILLSTGSVSLGSRPPTRAMAMQISLTSSHRPSRPARYARTTGDGPIHALMDQHPAAPIIM